MKRTAAAFMLLAGLSGCMTPDKLTSGKFGKATRQADSQAFVGPHGEPVAPVQYQARGKEPGIMRADYREMTKGGIVQASASSIGFPGSKANEGWVATGNDGIPGFYPGRGILPTPGMGPFGAVAAVGALPSGPMTAPINARTAVRFSEPADMKITWFSQNGWNDTPLNTPASYNFAQGGVYRLKVSNIQGRPGKDLYPTLEIVPSTPKTAMYLQHSSVPLSFTDEDFEQVFAGNYLVKVIYLPDPAFQDLAAVAGPAEVISTRLDPGVDPVAEARRRGEILLIIRMGNIDLEAKGTPSLDAPNPFAGFGPGGPGGAGISGMPYGPIGVAPPKPEGNPAKLPKSLP